MKRLISNFIILLMITGIFTGFSVYAQTNEEAYIESQTEASDITASETQDEETDLAADIKEQSESELSGVASVSQVTMEDLSVGNNTITIKWNSVSGASKYRVSYQRSYWNYWKNLSDTSSLSYTDKNFTNGITYRYRVLPLDSSGNVLNSSHDTKSVTYRTTPTNIDAEPASSQGCIKITWDHVSGCSEYQVFYRRSTQNTWRKCKGTTALNSYVDTGCSNDIIYYYTVRCVDNGSYVSGFESGAVIHYYKFPESIKVVKYDNNGRIKITWGAVGGISKYQVFYRRSTQNTWRKCKGTASVNSYIDTGCSNDIIYYYTVRCLDDDGNYASSYGSGTSIHYYKIPADLKAVKYDDAGRIRITWTAISGASKYQVFYKRAGWTTWKKCKGYAYSASYIDTNCSSGITYYYTVRACNSSGDYISSYDPNGAKITYIISDWRTLYKNCISNSDYLNYVPSEFKSNNHYFEVHDMDGNGTPELISYLGNEPNTCARYLFLTVKNGKVVNLGNYTLGRNLFYDSSRLDYGLFSCGGSYGHNVIVNIKLSNSEMTITQVCQYDVKDSDNWYNGFNITINNATLYNVYVGCSTANSIYPNYVRTPYNQLRVYTLGAIEKYGWSYFYDQYGY